MTDHDTARPALLAERENASALRDSLVRDVADIVAASKGSNADDEHDPEGSTIAFERSQVVSLLAQTRRRLDDVDAALERLADGTYGTCRSCGSDIPAARLEARPVARTCVSCA